MLHEMRNLSLLNFTSLRVIQLLVYVARIFLKCVIRIFYPKKEKNKEMWAFESESTVYNLKAIATRTIAVTVGDL